QFFAKLGVGKADLNQAEAFRPARFFASFQTGNRSNHTAGKQKGRTMNARSAYFCHFERRQSLGCLPSSMRKAMLVAAIALVLGSTVTASDNARDWPYFEGPQQYLIGNLGEVLREQHALESCSQQQQEALQRFLKM